MTAKEKAEQLYDVGMALTGSKENARAFVRIICTQVKSHKNYPNTLHPEFIAFDNAYWDHVESEMIKLY